MTGAALTAIVPALLAGPLTSRGLVEGIRLWTQEYQLPSRPTGYSRRNPVWRLIWQAKITNGRRLAGAVRRGP